MIAPKNVDKVWQYGEEDERLGKTVDADRCPAEWALEPSAESDSQEKEGAGACFHEQHS